MNGSSDSPRGGDSSSVDPRVVAALDEYRRRVADGRRPKLEEYLAEHADFAESLRPCLEALAAWDDAGGTGGEHPSSPPRRIGDFRLLRELGRGGMGVVYEAEQISLKRPVALKVLPQVAAFDSKALRRFQHEAQAAAALRHPHIVPIYAVGEERGTHFYAMQLVDGRSLAELLDERRRGGEGTAPNGERSEASVAAPTRREAADRSTEVSTDAELAAASTAPAASGRLGGVSGARQAAEWIRQAAEALQHAHDVGILHRDVKPGNLLLDREGRLWVADFGLAKLPGSDLTGTYDLLGTLRYMAPEQAAGKALALDARTDVYSLGATLYELAAGRPAFAATDRQTLLQQVLHEEPPRLARVAPRIPGDLATIVHKAMAKEPSERYATAQDLADDLTRFLEDRPILARPPGALRRLRKWVARNRGLAATAAALTTIFALAGVVGLIMATLRIDDQRRQAEQALGRESKALRKASDAADRARTLLAAEQRARAGEREMSYIQSVSLAHAEAAAGHLESAERLLDACPEDLRGVEWEIVRRMCRAAALQLKFEARETLDLSISPAGELIVLGKSSTDVRDPMTGRSLDRRLPIALGPDAEEVQVSADGSVACAYRLRPLPATPGAEPPPTTVTTYDLRAGRILAEFRLHRAPLVSLAMSADGQRVVTVDRHRTLAVWNARDGSVVHWAPSAFSTGATISDDGNLVFYRILGARSSLLDPNTGRILNSWAEVGLAGRPPPIAISPDRRRLATGVLNGDLLILEAATGRTEMRLAAGLGPDSRVAFTPDGLSLVTTGHRDHSICIWNRRTGVVQWKFLTGRGTIRRVAFTPECSRLVALSDGGIVTVWDLAERLDRRFAHLASYVGSASVNVPGSSASLTQSVDGKAHLLFRAHVATPFDEKLEAGGLLQVSPIPFGRTIPVPPEFRILDATFVGGRRVARLASASRCFECELDSRRVVREWTFPGVAQEIEFEPFSADAGGQDDASTAPGRLLQFADDRLVLAASEGDGIRIEERRADDGRVLRTFRSVVHGRIYHVAAARDGRRRAAAVTGGNLLLGWNADESREAWSRPTPRRIVALEFDADGESLALLDASGEASVLDAASGRPRVSVFVPGSLKGVLALSRSGDRLALGVAAENTGEVRLYDARYGHLLAKLPFERVVDGLQFDAKGRLVVAETFGAVWQLPPGDLSADFQESRRRIALERFWSLRLHEARLLGEPEVTAKLRERYDALRPDQVDIQGLMDARYDLRRPLSELNDDELSVRESFVSLADLKPAFELSAIYSARGDFARHRRLCRGLFLKVDDSVTESLASMVFRLGPLVPSGVDNWDVFIASCESKFAGSTNESRFALLFNRGMARYRAGRHAEAKEDLTTLWQRHRVASPSYPIVFVFLAMCEAQTGDRQAGADWLRQAEARFESEAESRRKRGVTHLVEPHFPLLLAEARRLLEREE